MADSLNCDLKSLSPLQLFERVTEQGEKVRALKAGKAPKVFPFHILNPSLFKLGLSLRVLKNMIVLRFILYCSKKKDLFKKYLSSFVNWEHTWSQVVTRKSKVFTHEVRTESHRLRNLVQLVAMLYDRIQGIWFLSKIYITCILPWF